uniref:Uncharacterized protein n=1 Tax=Rhizophora mucronata TaxID=61149 RepID=A0A2P2N4B8_RHIMU
MSSSCEKSQNQGKEVKKRSRNTLLIDGRVSGAWMLKWTQK